MGWRPLWWEEEPHISMVTKEGSSLQAPNTVSVVSSIKYQTLSAGESDWAESDHFLFRLKVLCVTNGAIMMILMKVKIGIILK